MKKTAVDKIYCKHCGSIRLEDDLGACPSCGKTGRIIEAAIEDDANFSSSLGWKHTKEYYEENKRAQFVILLISIVSPLIGLLVGGVPGVIIGLIFSLLSYFFGANAIMKVREITRGGDL